MMDGRLEDKQRFNSFKDNPTFFRTEDERNQELKEPECMKK